MYVVGSMKVLEFRSALGTQSSLVSLEVHTFSGELFGLL